MNDRRNGHEYIAAGGMPKAVVSFSRNQDFHALFSISVNKAVYASPDPSSTTTILIPFVSNSVTICSKTGLQLLARKNCNPPLIIHISPILVLFIIYHPPILFLIYNIYIPILSPFVTLWLSYVMIMYRKTDGRTRSGKQDGHRFMWRLIHA